MKTFKSVNKVRERWKTIGIFFAAQLFFASMILSFAWGQKIVFGILVAIPPLAAAVTMSRRGLFFIFYFMCMTLMIGQRTIYIGPNIRIVPAEVLLILLFVFCLSYQSRSPLLRQGTIPIPAIVLSAFSLFAIYTTYRWANFYWDSINTAIGYAILMWLSIPAFFVCGRLIQRLDQMKTILTIIMMGCFFLSALGLIEYFNLPFIKYFGGFLNEESLDRLAYEGFRRLGASFWGGPMLAGFLTLCFPLLIAHWINAKTMTQKVLFGGTIILTFLVIYYSGHRGLWVACLFGIACFFYLKGLKGIFILMLLATLGLQFLPKEAKARIKTLYGETEDSSAKKRKERAEEAWQIVLKDPVVGSGWGASGLVHSDMLQIWADAGGFTLASFVLLFFQILGRLWLRFRMIKDRVMKEYCCGFFGSLAGVFVVLMDQAWLNLPEQYIAFWIIMALAYQYPNVILNETRIQAYAVMQQQEKKNV